MAAQVITTVRPRAGPSRFHNRAFCGSNFGRSWRRQPHSEWFSHRL